MSNDNNNSIFFAVLSALLVLIGFGFGYFVANTLQFREKPVQIEKSDNSYSTKKSDKAQPRKGEVVGSVNSDKYHYPECPGAKQIKEENKIVFDGAKQARAAGYVLAGNCN